MTAPAAARASREGDPCPPWCITDHAEYNVHSSERIIVEAPRYHQCSTRAIRYTAGVGGSRVQVAGGGVTSVYAVDAEGLAELIEGLAEATPAQHRELAEAIRQAAAVITEAGNG